MQKAEINYTGISTRPSEYNCKDGELALLQNLINEDGALKPLGLPPVSFSQAQELLFVHRNAGYSNYIFKSGKSLFYSKDGSTIKYDLYTFDVEIKSISAIGNMLLILTEGGLYYAMYSNELYSMLGNKLPELPDINITATFIPDGIRDTDNTTSISKTITSTKIAVGSRASDGDRNVTDGEKYILDEFYSLLEQEIANYYDNNKFLFPFFIRYAFRLYDGSLVCHSAPILVLPNNRNYILKTPDAYSNLSYAELNVSKIAIEGLSPSSVSLKFNKGFNIGAWKDLIQSVDVFISQPLYPINMGAPAFESITSVITGYDNNRVPTGGYISYTLKGNPSYSDFILKIKENSLFYKVASYEIEKINNLSNDLSEVLPTKNIKTIVNQEVMTDDYKSRNINYANGLYVYNGRVNLFGLKNGLFSGFPISKFINKTTTDGTTAIAVYIKNTSGQISIVRSICAGTYKVPIYFFYPDSLAYKMVITTGGNSKEFPLEAHKGLNGSQYVCPTLEELTLSGTPYETQESNTIVSSPNEIKLSEVNNPFTFKASNYYTIGTGEVLCVSSATKALSQGQFGQFPLYAFTTEGIWALEISSNGTYSVKHPATRDVCNNVDSIVQLDGAIAFTTKQGLMLLIGSDSKCISENLDDTPFQTLQFLDQFTSVLQIPIKTYLEGCRIAYDYTNSRIIVFNPSQSYSYVYSMKSQKWSILNQTFSKVLNVYPDCFLQKVNGSNFDVIDISSDYTPENIQGVIVTRSIKFDNPNILKTIHQVVHNGIFRKGKVKSILYGSRDYINYFPITSSADNFIRSVLGTSYKCFRFVISVDLSDGESISSTSIVYETKYNNKLR